MLCGHDSILCTHVDILQIHADIGHEITTSEKVASYTGKNKVWRTSFQLPKLHFSPTTSVVRISPSLPLL